MHNDRITAELAHNAISGALSLYFSVTPQEASPEQMYRAAAMVVRDRLLQKQYDFNNAVKTQRQKRLYYFSVEFLVGRSLKNNLYNLGWTEAFDTALAQMGVPLEDLYELEPDAGLGNGGLGRLAACYMDALATLDLPAHGFSILYEYGLFKQKIVDGWQTELPDVWLPGGEVWLHPRPDLTCTVRFNGQVRECWEDGACHIDHTGFEEVEAVPYDMMIPGADSDGVSVLRLWRARDRFRFDMNSFASGDYARATMQSQHAELISKVLYPTDNHVEGRSLRLRQQYFLVSASMQYITKIHFHRYQTFENFAEKVAIHINDTHPALCIPELMRIFLDDYHMDWDYAMNLVRSAMGYTNHTVMAEALETWPETLVQSMMPRVYMIIQEINNRHCHEVWEKHPGAWEVADRVSVLSHGAVRMANLAIVGSHAVNGVSKLHSDILRSSVFRDFAQMEPWKFQNITNGIAHRRWLCQANPGLTQLLRDTIGNAFEKQPETLSRFGDFAGDAGVLSALAEIKQANKQRLARHVIQEGGPSLPTDFLYDVHVKRLHEYKRQLLNGLHILWLYQQIKDNPSLDIPPRVFLFGAKAAPSYYMAKQIISFLVHLGRMIDRDPAVRGKLRLVFLENYSVTMAERLMPAADVSEQISLAGKEASGTGNMKLMLNGAVTLGTLDGANIEILQAVGRDNIFIFGMNDAQVEELWRNGYSAARYYQHDQRLKSALDALSGGIDGMNFSELSQYLLVGQRGVADPYMCLADFDAYAQAQQRVGQTYRDTRAWQQMSLRNIAAAGVFAADRAIGEYAQKIWGLTPVQVM